MTNLQDQIVQELGEKMHSEIDREILWGMLTGMGWTRVMLSRFQDNYHAVDITYWLEDNILYPYERNGADFLFQDKHDATLFILRWQ